MDVHTRGRIVETPYLNDCRERRGSILSCTHVTEADSTVKVSALSAVEKYYRCSIKIGVNRGSHLFNLPFTLPFNAEGS